MNLLEIDNRNMVSFLMVNGRVSNLKKPDRQLRKRVRISGGGEYRCNLKRDELENQRHLL